MKYLCLEVLQKRSPTLGDQELILSLFDTTCLLPDSTVAGDRLVHMAPLEVASTTGKEVDKHQTVVFSAGLESSSSPQDSSWKTTLLNPVVRATQGLPPPKHILHETEKGKELPEGASLLHCEARE